jgi:predicted glycosyltransferase
MERPVWIDILTPKQALFFWPLIERLRRRVKVLVTARRYEQLNWVLRLLNLGAVLVGHFGGDSLVGKLASSTERQRMLVRLVSKSTPLVAISSGSVEAARICFGIRIPHLLASDTPHSPVNRLCVPLSEKIFTPRYIPTAEWFAWGARRGQIAAYRALDPIVWVRRARELEEIAKVEPPEDEYVLVRVPEYKASYILGRGLDESVRAIREAQRLFGSVIVLCRYRGEAAELEKRLGRGVRLIRRPVLAIPYIRRALLVLSGGGTIAQEAALLGKPTILFYPGETPAVHRFLARRGLLKVAWPRDAVSLRRMMEDVMREDVRAELRRRAERLVSEMEDPLRPIENHVLSSLD